MLRSIIPRDEAFFDMFDSLARHILDGTRILVDMLSDGEELDVFADRLHQCEHGGDDTVHRAMAHLHRTFVTPLDRADIQRLVVRLDDILDLAHAAGSRLSLYRPKRMLPEARNLAATLLAAVELVAEMVSLLRNLKQSKRIMDLTIAINSRENEADSQRRNAVARLLAEEEDPFEFIKWKEILDLMEEATDRCENVADIVEGIVLANG